MRPLRQFVLFITVFFLVPVCLGQSDQTGSTPEDNEPANPKKRYQVEVIAFQYHGPDSSGEQFDTLFVEEYLPPESFDIDEYNRVTEAVSYTEMTHLNEALEKLRLDPLYTVVLDVAWVQPLLARNEAVNVPVGDEARTATYSLHAGSRDPATSRLAGSVRVYGDYLLFVDLDLRLTVPPRRQGGETGSDTTFGLSTLTDPFAGDSADAADRRDVFHISERRRIKLDEIHYFDHPHIGAIVSVTRYEKDPGTASLE
jgi:hypothetical protein